MIAKAWPDYIDNTHTPDNSGLRLSCARCRAVGGALESRCPGAAWDYSFCRPWTAEPGEKPSDTWRVTCPARSGRGTEVICTHLSEIDAKAIAEGGNRFVGPNQ